MGPQTIPPPLLLFQSPLLLVTLSQKMKSSTIVEGLTKLDPDVCRMKCKEHKDEVNDNSDEPKCQFFRFEKGHSAEQRCSLQTVCGDGDQYCGKPECVTGELGCDDEGNEIKDCSLLEATPWDSDKFHVICTDVHLGDVKI